MQSRTWSRVSNRKMSLDNVTEEYKQVYIADPLAGLADEGVNYEAEQTAI